jgi:membrane protein
VAGRGQLWIENQDPASRKGATIGWVRRYRAADGQLYAVLLAAYVLLTLLPALLVESTYIFSDPSAWSNRVERRLGLTGETATLFHQVLVGAGNHKVASLLIALLNLLVFGMGFGRVLQLAHARSWGLNLQKNAIVDQARYLGVLSVLIVLAFILLLQARMLQGDPGWIGFALDVVWLAVLVGFFTWAPWMLLHRRVAARDVLPGAVFTVLGFVALRVISSFLLTRWLTSYSTTYGSFGIVMAIVFWIILLTTVMVLAAALSPALAHRRSLIEGRLDVPLTRPRAEVP